MEAEKCPSMFPFDLDKRDFFFPKHAAEFGNILLSFVNHGLQSGTVVERSDLVSASALAFTESQFTHHGRV